MTQCVLCDKQSDMYYRIGDHVFCRNHYKLAVSILTRWVNLTLKKRTKPALTTRQLLEKSLEEYSEKS